MAILITYDMRTQEGRDGARDMLAKLAGEPKREFVGPPSCPRTAEFNRILLETAAAINARFGRGRAA